MVLYVTSRSLRKKEDDNYHCRLFLYSSHLILAEVLQVSGLHIPALCEETKERRNTNGLRLYNY